MEIEFRSLNWQKTIWFLFLLFLSVTAMKTESVSSIGTTNAPSFPSSTLKDEGEWNEAEEVERSSTSFDYKSENDIVDAKNLELDLEDELLAYWDEMGFDDMDCESFPELPQPPNWDDLRPPPLPTFLKEIGVIFEESWRRRALILSYPDVALEGLNDFKEELEHISEEGKCPLCEWSHGNNETLAVLTRRPNETKTKEKSSNPMTWALVGVAFISASIGAVLMGLLLKCKRKDVINICNKSSSSTTVPESGLQSENNPSKMEGLRLALKNLRGHSSPEPSVDPYRAENVTNPCGESLSINTDSASTLYAEINNPAGVEASGAAIAQFPLNTFSTAPDPLISSSGLSVMYNKIPKNSSTKDGTYANNAYVVSEASSEPNESSGGSTSTPSSAYYSDVSTTVEIHSSKRKKKKRKTDERIVNLANIRFAQSVRIGNFPPTVASSQFLPHPISKQESIASPMHASGPQYPSESSLEANLHDPCESSGHRGVTPISANPGIIRTDQGITGGPMQISIPCIHPVHTEYKPLQTNQIQNIPLCPHCHTVYPDEMTLRSATADGLVQRPLPPLPSRQMQGPRKRVADGKVHIEQSISAVPSEYI